MIVPSKQRRWTYPFHYEGSVFWLIFFCIFWLPIALLLFIKNARFHKENGCFSLHYRGTFGWLFFWAIVFFPLSIILLVIVGFDLIEEEL